MFLRFWQGVYEQSRIISKNLGGDPSLLEPTVGVIFNNSFINICVNCNHCNAFAKYCTKLPTVNSAVILHHV